MASNAAAEKDKIILYHYPFSPYAKRIIWYLRLRQIPYYECIQPPLLPRPDLSTLLGINYRRIPLLSHNSQIYLDTRLILSHLESLPLSSPPLLSPSSTPPDHSLLISLLSTLTTQTDLFFRAAELLPPSLPLLRDPAFQKDRASFFPPPSDTSISYELRRAEALTTIRDVISLFEETVFKDGRKWVLGGDKPGLADIEAIWIFSWVFGIKEMVPQEWKEKYSGVYGWTKRFEGYVEGLDDVRVGKVSGEEAKEMIMGEAKGEYEGSVQEGEAVVKALGVKGGEEIEVWPVDSGSGFRDRGELVGLDEKEIVWRSGKGVVVHAPRRGFRVGGVGEKERL
ncbi:hypothetical protein QBC38DRAFT_484485 [Podospora fimiseda]|uniref:GST N-terminal domain-containing protein n=1 Tax=Podospora fimiseda TaxID=252190 RepID=A0AAN7BK09_9PEZI|nr:hypothetical protein QBC38DRAFT_484485 [Podospora fimiseda]